jgi:3-oxoacyl-[acyl-carrier-protein] synthase II
MRPTSQDRFRPSFEPRRVVVTGLGAVSPNGIGARKYWESLVAGRSGVKRVEGIDARALKTRIAGQIQDFNPRDALPEEDPHNIWRAIPLLAAAAREALEDAGLRPKAWPTERRRRIGAVVGTCGAGSDYREPRTGPAPIALAPLTGPEPNATIGTLSSEISMHFGMLGPSHVITSGWTSSTDAIGYAYLWIRTGEMDFVVTGGVEAPLAPAVMKGYEKSGMTTEEWNDAPEAASRPFDRARSGFVLAEGAWALVLEDRDRAMHRGARIWGEVGGYASNCDSLGGESESAGAMASARAMIEALHKAGLRLDQVDYVQLHGASTRREDRAETEAVKHCFGGRAPEIPVSSVKSTIGHPQGACGAAGAVAALMAMAHGLIPPTINLDALDPECELNHVVGEAIKKEVRVAICNTLGLRSKNAALVFCRSKAA